MNISVLYPRMKEIKREKNLTITNDMCFSSLPVLTNCYDSPTYSLNIDCDTETICSYYFLNNHCTLSFYTFLLSLFVSWFVQQHTLVQIHICISSSFYFSSLFLFLLDFLSCVLCNSFTFSPTHIQASGQRGCVLCARPCSITGIS